MERYISESPSEFPPILIEQAKAARLKHWFDEGKTIMKGGYKGGSPIVWQTIMRNMFKKEIGWDVEEKKEEEFDSSKLDALANLFDSVSKIPKSNPFTILEEVRDPEANPQPKQLKRTNFP